MPKYKVWINEEFIIEAENELDAEMEFMDMVRNDVRSEELEEDLVDDDQDDRDDIP